MVNQKFIKNYYFPTLFEPTDCNYLAEYDQVNHVLVQWKYSDLSQTICYPSLGEHQPLRILKTNYLPMLHIKMSEPHASLNKFTTLLSLTF